MFTCKGTLRKRLSDQNLTSKAGNPYRLGQYLFDMDDQKGAFISFKTFGDINEMLVEGDHYDIQFSISTREYNGKYYTDFLVESANRLTIVVEEKSVVDEWAEQMANDQEYASGPPLSNPFENTPKNDLPF